MEAIIDSNSMRKDFLGLEIAKLNPKKVGIYRLAMKEGSIIFVNLACKVL